MVIRFVKCNKRISPSIVVSVHFLYVEGGGWKHDLNVRRINMEPDLEKYYFPSLEIRTMA